jgi:hypothetical protein
VKLGRRSEIGRVNCTRDLDISEHKIASLTWNPAAIVHAWIAAQKRLHCLRAPTAVSTGFARVGWIILLVRTRKHYSLLVTCCSLEKHMLSKSWRWDSLFSSNK